MKKFDFLRCQHSIPHYSSRMTATARQERIQLTARRCGITITEERDGAAIGYKSEWGPEYTAVVILTGRMRKPVIFAAFGLPLDVYLRRYNIATKQSNQ